MAGAARSLAGPLDGWPHVVQSIGIILSTPVGSRVMRRDFGSDVPSLLDRPLNAATVIDVMVAVAEALDRYEPRFRLQAIDVAGGGDGGLRLDLAGIYYPRGHLGDFSRGGEREYEVVL